MIGATGFFWLSTQAKIVERTLPPVRVDLAAELPTKSFIYANDGTVLAQLGSENRTWIDLSEISPFVIDALLATEDRRFFEHDGVDYRRLFGAALASFRGRPEGASTLTMQLVRNVYPEIAREKLVDRKAREILMARKIERVYTKRELLELYLNKMSFGNGAFGIEAAAETYFRKSAYELDMLESALLIGMLKGPSFFNPVQHPERAKARRRVVLISLVAHGKISEAVMSRIASVPIQLRMARRQALSGTAPHFAEYVRREMEVWGKANGFDIYQDGLRVYTTLDPYLQAVAEAVVDRQLTELQGIAGNDWAGYGRPFGAFWAQNPSFEEAQIRRSERFGELRAAGLTSGMASLRLRDDFAFLDSMRTASTRLETGLVAIDPHTGDVKAWVGARDFAVDQYDKVSSAHRQPGSIFKPILYAAAIEAGYTPHHYAEDVITSYVIPPFGRTWRPTNAGGGATGAILTLRQALAKSKNTVSAKLVQQIGPRRVVDMARRMGIRSKLLEVPSIALGTSEVTLLEMVSAYGTFVADGVHAQPRVIARIENARGEVVGDFDSHQNRVLAPTHSYTLLDMLRDVTRPGGTGAGLPPRFPIPGEWTGKTGTTQDNTDGWFVGIHPDLVVGSWVGFNQPAVRFRSDYYGQGAHNAGLVVAEFLQAAVMDPLSGIGPRNFNPPPGYVPPQPPADRFAGNLVDPERAAAERPAGIDLDRGNTVSNQRSPPALNRRRTSRPARKQLVW